MIVSKDDIKKLTGFVRMAAQVRWLQQHGWKFAVNRLGEPVIAVEEFNRQLVGGRQPKQVQKQEPDFSSINNLRKR